MSLNIQDLKCCGNCEHYYALSGYPVNDERPEVKCQHPDIEFILYFDHKRICQEWEFDGVSNFDRMIKDNHDNQE